MGGTPTPPLGVVFTADAVSGLAFHLSDFYFIERLKKKNYLLLNLQVKQTFTYTSPVHPPFSSLLFLFIERLLFWLCYNITKTL